MAYFLERDTVDGPYMRASVRHERDGLIYEEVFEIGEPVHLDSLFGSGDTQILWIRQILDYRGQAKVMVTTEPTDHVGEFPVPVQQLVKVPAMLRLALESQ